MNVGHACKMRSISANVATSKGSAVWFSTKPYVILAAQKVIAHAVPKLDQDLL